MIIKQEAVNDVLAKAQENFKKTGLSIKPNVMQRFENAISEIAANKSYKEGNLINEFDLTKIVNEAGLVLNDAISDNRNIDNPVDDLMSLTDYLYTLTMQKLGSPDIPVSFGPEMQKSIVKCATTVSSKQDLDQSYSFGERIYNKQRYMDADEVRNEISTPLSAAENGNPTPSQVQTLVAAYQALQKRQNDHGFFWRLFHRTENANRTELLSNMQSALKYVLGDDINIMKCSALFLAEKVLKQNMEGSVSTAFTDDGISKRTGVSVDSFVCSDVKQNDCTNELRENLINDINPQVNNEIQKPNIETIEAASKKL